MRLRKRVLTRVVLTVGVAWLLGAGQAGAQYTNTLNGRQFSNMWAAQADFTLSQMIQQAGWKAMNASLRRTAQQAQGNAPARPAAPAKFKYPLSRTDFKFVGQPTGQRNCAALAEQPADRQQLAEACLSIFREIQAMPEMRKNNLAAGLTVLIGISLQVSLGREIGDDDTEALQRGLNDLLVDSGVMKKLKPAEVQSLYETAVMTGGLIAGIAQTGAEQGDEDLSKLAKVLAKTVLASFGLKL